MDTPPVVKSPWDQCGDLTQFFLCEKGFWFSNLIISFTGLTVPQALDANPKQTRTVFSSNFRSKSDKSIVHVSGSIVSPLTSTFRFSARRFQGDTFASWHRSDVIILTFGYMGRLLIWSSIERAIWKVRVVILAPNVT